MKIEHSTTTPLLPGDICVLAGTDGAEYRVRHVDDGDVRLSALADGAEVIVPACDCRRIRSGQNERMEEAPPPGPSTDARGSSAPTFPDGTPWP